MPETRRSKTEYLNARKKELVTFHGCAKCKAGALLEKGFERYWFDDYYDARRFVFKYTDPRGSDVPVAKLPRMKTTTTTTIDEALARCVILCRSCADPRRTRKDDQCQKALNTTSSLPSS